jgi:hypothetical protein
MIPNDRQAGPAEEGEARLASPSSQSSVQQSILTNEMIAERAAEQGWRDEHQFATGAMWARDFLAGSTVSGQGEQTSTESLKNGEPGA